MQTAKRPFNRFFTKASVAVATLGCAFVWQGAVADVRIFNLDDYPLGTWQFGEGGVSVDNYFCVAEQGALNDNWRVTAYGDGAGSSFTLQDGTGNSLPYTVRVVTEILTENVQSSEFSNADTSSPYDCDGTDDKLLRISIEQADLEASAAGSYSGSLTLTVTGN